MSTAGYITFRLAEAPIAEPATKFGGRPLWLDRPQWPLSRRTGEQMAFLAQVALDPAIFGPCVGKLAYLFAAPTREWALSWKEWQSPDRWGRVMTVIIQPGENRHIETRPLNEGPGLLRRHKGRRRFLWFRERLWLPAEYAVSLTIREDPDELDETLDDPAAAVPHDMDDCKVGGLPTWIQDEEWPYPDSRRLLLQLVWGKFPFHLDLGDAGTLYAFLSRDGRAGKILLQCY
jgi:hypothetical protein